MLPAMKAFLHLRHGPATRLCISTLLASLALAVRAQMVEMDGMRKQAENGLPEAQNTLGMMYVKKDMTPAQIADAEKRVKEFKSGQ
jgi:hypothetical protein